MTTGQVICLAAIAAIVIIYALGSKRPTITGEEFLKSVTTMVIMAKEDNRCVCLKIRDREIEVFCGSRSINEPQAEDREPVL